MFGRLICHKLPECIFENFETARVKQGQFRNFQKSRVRITGDYWLITPKQPTFCIETNVFQQ